MRGEVAECSRVLSTVRPKEAVSVKPLEGHHVGIPATGEEVGEVFVHIVLQVAHGVGDRHEVALVRHVLAVAEVEDLLTCGGVVHDVAVGGAHIHGGRRAPWLLAT